MGLKFEQRHLDAALAAGACSVEHLALGTPVEDVHQSDLMWLENAAPEIAAQAAAEAGHPLYTLAGSGAGSGLGLGSGAGSGAGSGYGDGDGYGSGYGDGDGFGDGSYPEFAEALAR